MNIKSSVAAPKPAKTTITVNVPDVDAEALSDKAFDIVDSASIGLKKAGIGTLLGGIYAIPYFGLRGAQVTHAQLRRKPETANTVNQLANAGAGLAQVAGLGATALAGVSHLTGIGNAGAILTAAGCCFAAAGVGGFVYAMGTESQYL